MITKTIPSYQQGLQELRSRLSQMLPEEALDLFDKDAQNLQRTHTDILKVTAGSPAPDFSLSNATGEVISLKQLLDNGPVVLVFYRGAWCPYCNLQLQQYQKAIAENQSINAQLVAISPQTPDSSLSIKEKNALTFEVLSDLGNVVARKYTTVFKNSDAPLAKMEALGIDFTSFYGDDSKELPVPVVFIINKEGMVVFADTSGGDYRNRTEASEIINELQKLRS
jgi:peroxiredoxin